MGAWRRPLAPRFPSCASTPIIQPLAAARLAAIDGLRLCRGTSAAFATIHASAATALLLCVEAIGARRVPANLAVLENALQRYEYALAYTEQLLAMSPNDKRGLLMKLHFTTALGRPEEAEKVIARLQQMDEQGSLTVGEQQTLALYLEN